MNTLTFDPASFASLTRRLMARGRSVKAFGSTAETLISRTLRARGYRVQRQRGHRRGDLRVVTPAGQIMTVEVKAARRGVQGTYHFCLYRALPHRVCTDARQSDLLVLLCVTDAGQIVPFVLPAASTVQKQIAITSNPTTYSGKLARYRQQLGALTLEAVL